MHQHHKVTVGISPKPEILDSLCSCTECDSVDCFAKRQVDEPCACENCRNSKSCLFYNSKTNHSVSKSELNFKDIDIATENITRELFKKKVIYEFDKNMTTFTKKQSSHSYKTEYSKYETENDNNYLHIIRANSSRKEANLSTTKLSAEIMDVPYKDFQKTLFNPNFPSNMNKTSPFNIFNRIKEAYKACSCKVCECIVGKSLQNDLCRCEPCECDDCANFNRHMRSFTGSIRLVPKYDEVCSNIGCDDCKGIGKRKNEAQNSCDCLGLLKSEYRKGGDSLTQPCNCEPCQCIECKSRSIYTRKTLIVAPVEEDQQQRNECLCSPCECFQCGQTNGLLANLNHEMTTSITRHPHCHCEMCLNEACLPDGNQSCRCERQSKVTSKPVQQDSHDYDIRRTTISYDDAQRHSGKCDTIAMFTAITNLYKQQEQQNKCECDQCECLVCKYNTNTSLSSKMVEPLKCKPRNEVNDFKYSPCECQFCVKHHPNLPNLKKIYVCSCDVCDCMNCEDIERTNGQIENEDIKKPISTFSAREYCKCDKSEKLMNTCVGNISQCSNIKCENCIKKNNFDELIYPVRKGEQLTPSIFRQKIRDTLHKEKILKQPIALKSSLKKPSALSSVQETITRDYNVGASYQECFQDSHIDHQMLPSKIMTRNEFTGKHAQVSKCANGINMRCRNIEPALESNLYVNSSLSFLKESGSITPSKSRLKSWESSCNSSGHDYPSYLIHFPKTTVETCFNDVMQFDNDNNIKLTTMSMSSKNILQKQDVLDLSLPNYSKYQPVRTVFPVDKPTVNYNGGTNTEKNVNFKYFGQNYENNPYRPQNLETTPNVSKPKHNTTNLIRNSFPKRYEAYSTSGNKKKNLVNFALQEDYERVQNTLQEAREFSSQLVQLLEKYEKANSEFESVSKQIKMSNDHQINISKYPNTDENSKYSIDIDDELTMEDSLKVSSGSSTEELMEINKIANKMQIANFTNDHSFVDEANNIVSENISMSGTCDDNNEGRDESGDDIIKKNNELLTSITEEKEPIDKHIVRKKKVAKIPHKKHNNFYKHYLICSKKIKGFTNKSSAEMYTATETNCNTILQNNKTIEETHIFDKCIKEDFNTEVKLPKVAQGVNFKNSATGEFELRVPETEKHSKDSHIMQKDVGLLKQPMVKHDKQIFEAKEEVSWPILKKTFCLNTDSYTNDRRFSIMSPLENDTKAAAQTISKQPPDENATYLYDNKALVKLHFQVKKLMDMPILQTIESSDQKGKQDMYHNFSKPKTSQTFQWSDKHNMQKSATTMTASVEEANDSSRQSCDSMKVKMLNVRRVSDHTALIKWNLPRLLDNVQGYELLVDGRAVQKIFSPSRRMAVVTCLPHCDKIMLTVRTVPILPYFDHCPTVTVIYQPKNK